MKGAVKKPRRTTNKSISTDAVNSLDYRLVLVQRENLAVIMKLHNVFSIIIVTIVQNQDFNRERGAAAENIERKISNVYSTIKGSEHYLF